MQERQNREAQRGTEGKNVERSRVMQREAAQGGTMRRKGTRWQREAEIYKERLNREAQRGRREQEGRER